MCTVCKLHAYLAKLSGRVAIAHPQLSSLSFSATANPVPRLGLLDAASVAVVQRARLDVGVLCCAVLHAVSPCKNASSCQTRMCTCSVLVDDV
jgi:hypothetical protein